MNQHQYRCGYLRLGDDLTDIDDDNVLYLDPLTTLAAYPSFEQAITAMLPLLASGGLHLSIGDVDGLREYVSERRSADPASFGHLAGNACMRTIGRLTTGWSMSELSDLAFRVCGTFGGDEVIIAASGISHDLFNDKINVLARTIKDSAPRPCSFALATLEDRSVTRDSAADAYRRFVSMVDSRLFREKERARHGGGHLDGSVTDLGVVNLLGQDVNLLDQDGAGHPAPIGGGQ